MDVQVQDKNAVAPVDEGRGKQFVAVKRGRYVQDCIFLSLEHAQMHIQDKTVAKYGVFGTLEEAVNYLASPPPTALSESLAENEAPGNTAENPSTVADGMTDTSNTINLPLIYPPQQRPVPSAPNTRKRKAKSISRGTEHGVMAYEVVDDSSHRKRRPTKKWLAAYANLRAMKDRDGIFPSEVEDSALQQWIKNQDDEYAKYLEGKPSAMFGEKIRLLREIGFVFRREREAQLDRKMKNSQGRKVYKNWQNSLEKLKVYMDQNNGSWDVPRSEDANLRDWVLEQRLELQKMVDGKPTSMTQEKLQRLRNIGVDIKVTSWKERMDQLRAYKAEHGNLKIPMKHPTLGQWANAIRRQIQVFVHTGKETKDIDAGRLSELKDLGFDLNSKNNEEEKRKEEWNIEFEEMFQKLKLYKERHGDCKVTRSKDEGKDLHNWVVRVRIEYNKLANNDPLVRLTAFQLQKLTEIGFAFRQKGSYKTWERRIEELKRYKAIHGNLNSITISHPELGEFVGRQRKQYREYCDGQKVCLLALCLEVGRRRQSAHLSSSVLRQP
jgi:hypothetical protein